MAVALSIKGVPDHIAKALKVRAAKNHRSIQGELLHILEQAVADRPFQAHELVKRLRKLELPQTDNESTRFIREERDRR